MSLPRPQMRNLLLGQIKRNLAMTAGVCTAAVSGYYFIVNKPRKERYAEFYKNYDAEAEFERMRKLGLFQSCPADEE